MLAEDRLLLLATIKHTTRKLLFHYAYCHVIIFSARNAIAQPSSPAYVQ
jgi:hypothetical protein